MTHIPTNIDIKTDLRRGIMASFSTREFDDPNFKIFIKNALVNLELLKDKIGTEKYRQVLVRINKSADLKNSAEKRREDILTAFSLL
jgi:hypothetical protein